MPAMSEAQIDELLHSNTVCRLACVDYDGAPYVVPCWFTYADGGFYVVPRARSAWAGYMKSDGRVFLCIDSDHGGRVLVKGQARVVEEPNVGGKWVEIGKEMAERYGGEAGLKYLDTTKQEPRWLFFIEAGETLSSTGGWAQRYKHYDW